MAQQTAVEWLVKELNLEGYDHTVQQAKEMEQEQKKIFFDCGRQYQLTGEGTFNQVYNETYGKE